MRPPRWLWCVGMGVVAWFLQGCTATGFQGPSIAVTGGFPSGLTFGFSLPGYSPVEASPLAEAAALLSIQGLPERDPKEPILPK